MSAHTLAPRPPTTTKRNDTRMKVPASVPQRLRNPLERQVAPVEDSRAQEAEAIHEGPYIPLKQESSARTSLGSNDVHVIGKPTSDSMVENMLLSFDKIPNGQLTGRLYPPSSYTRPVTAISGGPIGQNSAQPTSTHQTSQGDTQEPQKAGSSSSIASRQKRRSSVGEYTLFEVDRGDKGKVSHSRGLSASQIRRPQSQANSVDINSRGKPQLGTSSRAARPATAPYSSTQPAASPIVTAESRVLHSASPSSPRLSSQAQQTSSVALAAAAAAVTAQKPADRLQQPALAKAKEVVKSAVVQSGEQATLSGVVRSSQASLREARAGQERRPSKNGSLPERPPMSPSTRTTSDLSTRKSSTARSSSDRALSRTDSVDSEGRPLKQRSGFFRRVFGSSSRGYSNTSPLGTPLPSHNEEPPQLPPLNVKSHRPEKSRARMNPNQYAGQLLYLPNPPTPSPPEDIPDPMSKLNKKQSFFRRKRRASDQEFPRPFDEYEEVSTMSSPSRTASSTAEPSPSISSLRKVMNPYLLAPSASSRTTSPHDLSPSNYFGRVSADVIAEEQGSDGVEEVATAAQRSPRSRLGPFRNEMPRSSNSTTAGKLAQAPVIAEMKRAHAEVDENQNPYVIDGSPNPDRDSVVISEVTSMRNESPKRQRTSWTRLGDETSPPALDFSNVANLHSTSIDVLGLRPLNHPEEVQSPSDAASLPSDDDWIMTSPIKKMTQEVVVTKPHRIWLKSSASEELFSSDKWPLPPPSPPHLPPPVPAQPAAIPEEVIVTAANTPTKRSDTSESSSRGPGSFSEFHAPDPTDPTEVEQQLARKIFNGPSAGFDQDQAAMALGEAGLGAQRLRRAYMSLFDFAGTNILVGMRELCGRLALKGETQQVDRILLAFSQRWIECNPGHGFKTLDVIHTLCYSLLLLNTDLHVADLEQKMTRNQFVKNTLFAIAHSVEDSDTDTLRSLSKATTPIREDPPPLPKSPLLAAESFMRRPSFETRISEGRLSVRSTIRPTSAVRSSNSPTPYGTRVPEAGDALMNTPFRGSNKAWEAHLELLLKEFYNSVRLQRLPLFGASKPVDSANSASPSNSWLHRSGSTVSKAPAETARSFASELRSVGSRWGSKSKSRPNVYSSSTMDSSRAASRTSLDDPSSWTPSPSSTWSKSFRGKPPGTMSTDSLGTHITSNGDGFHQSVGFANALSHAIIREEFMSESESDGPVDLSIEEEQLGLAGAPWAKEGIVQYKHHLAGSDKKSKDRNWNECFAVVEKGSMKLFSFSSKGSVRNQKKRNMKQGAIVGGGNWTENAEAVDNFTLRQTLANILPSPGYSKARPHVFALSLPNGAVHLFGVGTPEIAQEFVATANYWSARLSKEPLMGGVSNIEYGWGDSIINVALLTKAETPKNERPPSSATTSYPPSSSGFAASMGLGPRPSIQNSIRNSLDGGNNARPRLPGDRAQLNDWTPPQQSLMASALSEDAQLDALRAYVHGVEEELARHNELRPPMLLVFSNRHPNAAKAMMNWERKSSYLLREIVKFRTYIDSLTAARSERVRVLAERSGFGGRKGVGGVVDVDVDVAAAGGSSSNTTTPTGGSSFRERSEGVRKMEELSLRDDEGKDRTT